MSRGREKGSPANKCDYEVYLRPALRVSNFVSFYFEILLDK